MFNANTQLAQFTGSEQFYKYTFGLLLTEGTFALAETYRCWWFIDVAVSYQPELKKEEFQQWKLLRCEDESAVVTCDDGNGKVLVTQEIPWTDFEPTSATIWLEHGVIMLPSER